LKVAHTVKLDNDLYARIRNTASRDEVVTGRGDVKNHLG
jgi:hypothetical protein